jgi:hypothetical protein
MADPFKELENTQVADPFSQLEGADTSDPFSSIEQGFGEQPGYTESAIRGAAQGVTFNAADEITGLTEALAAKAEGSRESFGDLYSRYRDESRAAYSAAEKANPKTFLAGQLAGGVAVPGAGWLASGKTIGTAVRAGAIAGGLSGFGAAEGDVGEQLKDAATGAALGGAAGGALAGVIKGAGALMGGGKAAKQVARSLPEITPLAQKIKDTIPDNLDDALQGKDAQFMQYVLRTKVPETVEEAFQKAGGKQNQRAAKVMDRAVDNYEQFERVMNQFDPKLRAQMYDEYRGAQAVTQAARDLKSQFMNKLRVTEYDPVQGWMSWIRPANFNAQRVDTKYGSDFTGALLDAVEAENKLASGATPYLKKALSFEKEMADAMKESGKFNSFDDYSRDLYMRITQGKFKPGSLESRIAQYFDDARDTLNKEYGLNIQKLQPYGKQTVYLPRTRMDLDSMRLKLDRATDRLFAGSMPAKEQKAYWDAMRYLGNEFGETLDPTASKVDLKQFIEKKLLKTAEDRGAVKRLEAAAAFGRDHDLPPYIVEYDIPKLMANYVNGNMKAGLYQVPMARMSAQIEAARTLGLPKTAEYFQQVQDSLMGTPSGWKAKMQERASQWRLLGQRTMDDASTPLGKMQGMLQRTVPDFIPWSMGNMYYNLLNANPYSIMRNLTQPIMGGSTDIAAKTNTAYASKITALGLKDMLKRGADKPNVIGLANEGPLRNEATQGIIKGLRESGVPEAVLGGIKGYEKFASTLMQAYSKADDINRRWTMNMADRVAKDVAANNPNALKIVASLPKGIKARVNQAIAAGNQVEVQNQLRRWFNIQHQYSYTTADMSRLGREFGSMLTAFTKFPTSVASDVEQEFYKNGLAGAFPVTKKYLFPLAALIAADSYTKDARENMDPKLKLVFGDNFRELSPALGIVLQPPPFVGSVAKATTAATKGLSGMGDLEPEEMPAHVAKTGVKILDAAAPFIPGYGFAKFTKNRLEKGEILPPSEDEE